MNTGELNWKPVTSIAIREPAPTVIVTTNTDKLRCTGGHLFWVSGRGWVKASQLNSGDVLHAAGTPAIIDSIEDTESIETYNLVIAENNTYFVGEGMVLAHDVMPREHQPWRSQDSDYTSNIN